ncbi:MAG: hypothetical protein A2451_02170 [Bdellovibrionales bacterium RIFOXYC2_FULL_39_8]|nr:MAG: hypothetical protein A2451_02170 [Bdellovibrionales bacterium RIFOXYC2_FULL_39_8]
MLDKYSILIVEDIPVQAKKLQYVLQKLGHNVVWKEDGVLAYEELQKNSERYHLVISDYQMPNWDGIQLLEAIKLNDKLKKIPFILLTTIEDENIFFKSLQLGASEFLNKPYRQEELKLRCQNLILLYEYQSLIEKENQNLFNELLEKNQILEHKLAELSKTHTQLQQMQTDLVQASKMASLGTMGAGMAHEINNPLTIIKSYNSRLKAILDKEEFDKTRVDKINTSIDNAVNRIMSIVKHLKAFARNEKISDSERATIDINQLLSDLRDFYGGLVISNNITVFEQFFSGDYKLFGFRTVYEQIFLNLINNAIDAMETSPVKTLDISTELIDDNQKILATIRDSGRGIPKEIMDKIYDPFFTTKAPNKGTGLGMSLVRSYLKECNGTISCQSEPGKTEFFLTFPIYTNNSKDTKQ